jgi:HD superfamily phosphodiesterase
MRKMNIVERVRQFVEDECKKPTSKYGYEPFTNHFAPVVEFSSELAKEMSADLEIVKIAGWFHDIGSIMVGREDHHIASSKIAGEKLKEFGYPEDRRAWVVDCILTHRGSQKMKPKTIEGQILVEADTMSAFLNISMRSHI